MIKQPETFSFARSKRNAFSISTNTNLESLVRFKQFHEQIRGILLHLLLLTNRLFSTPSCGLHSLTSWSSLFHVRNIDWRCFSSFLGTLPGSFLTFLSSNFQTPLNPTNYYYYYYYYPLSALCNFCRLRRGANRWRIRSDLSSEDFFGPRGVGVSRSRGQDRPGLHSGERSRTFCMPVQPVSLNAVSASVPHCTEGNRLTTLFLFYLADSIASLCGLSQTDKFWGTDRRAYTAIHESKQLYTNQALCVLHSYIYPLALSRGDSKRRRERGGEGGGGKDFLVTRVSERSASLTAHVTVARGYKKHNKTTKFVD